MKRISLLFALPLFLSINACDGGGDSPTEHDDVMVADNCSASRCDSVDLLLDSLNILEQEMVSACGWNFGFKGVSSNPGTVRINGYVPTSSKENNWEFHKIELAPATLPGQDPSINILTGTVKLKKDVAFENQGGVFGSTTFIPTDYAPGGVDSVYLIVENPDGITSTLHKRKKKGLMAYDDDALDEELK